MLPRSLALLVLGAASANATTGSGAAAATASSCPPAPANYTAFPNRCIGTAAPSCAAQIKFEYCSAGLDGCVAAALASCSSDATCHSFGLNAGPNCSSANACTKKNACKWQTFKLGKATTVLNDVWVSYARAGSAGPSPSPSPSPHPPAAKPCSGMCALTPNVTCPFKEAAYRHARKLQPWRDHVEVFDSLQLGPGGCNLPRPMPRRHGSSSRSSSTSSAPEEVIYADAVHGNDSNGSGSLASPFRSVARALFLSRKNGVRAIVLRAGTYHQGEHGGPLQLGPEDSGLVLAAMAGEEVVLTGGVGLNCSWRKPAAAAAGAGVGVNANVSICELPARFSEEWPNMTELLVGARRMQLARWPNRNVYDWSTWQGGMSATDWGMTDASQNQNVIKAEGTPFLRDSPHFPYFEAAYGGSTDVWTTNLSYWGVNNQSGPNGGGTWHNILGHAWKCDSSQQRGDPDSPCFRTWSDPAEAVAWCVPGWANEAFQYAAMDSKTMNVSFAKGGYQMSRHFYVEGVREELDSDEEYYYDRKANALLFYPNHTLPAEQQLPNTGLTAVTMEQIISIRGTQAHPVRDITIKGITFRGAAKTMLSPHESTNSGADWAAPRRAAVAIEGAEGVDVAGCAFETLGGSAVLWSNYVRSSRVSNCSFAWLGGNAVLAMGTDQFGDATDGEHPYNNTVAECYAREIGVFAKHSGLYAEFVAGAVNLVKNIAFNGPRAAIALNDGMGGGTNIEQNLLFEMVRETADHGPINSWDRQSFLTNHGPGIHRGKPSANYSTNTIHHNFIIGGFHGAWFPIDHDDGSAEYHDYENFLLFGGHKNYLGHSKLFERNLQVYPDLGSSYPTRVACMDYDPAAGEQYRNNTCVLHGAEDHWWCNGTSGCGVISVRGCVPNASDPKAQSLQASHNYYYVPNADHAQTTAAVYWDGDDNRGADAAADSCKIGGSVSIAELQAAGQELGTVVRDTKLVDADVIVAMGEALLARA